MFQWIFNTIELIIGGGIFSAIDHQMIISKLPDIFSIVTVANKDKRK